MVANGRMDMRDTFAGVWRSDGFSKRREDMHVSVSDERTTCVWQQGSESIKDVALKNRGVRLRHTSLEACIRIHPSPKGKHGKIWNSCKFDEQFGMEKKHAHAKVAISLCEGLPMHTRKSQPRFKTIVRGLQAISSRNSKTFEGCARFGRCIPRKRNQRDCRTSMCE